MAAPIPTLAETSLLSGYGASPTERKVEKEIWLPKLKHATEQASAVLNTLGGMASVVSTTCASAKQARCSTLAAFLSGATWLVSGVSNEMAMDMGDINYREIIDPGLAPTPSFESPAALRDFVKILNEGIVLAKALYTTANRATAAAEAGDSFWLQQQLTALKFHQTQLDLRLERLTVLLDSYEVGANAKLDEIKAKLAEYQGQAADIIKDIQEAIPSQQAKISTLSAWICSKLPDYWGIAYLKAKICN
jgi:hypothetical protein